MHHRRATRLLMVTFLFTGSQRSLSSIGLDFPKVKSERKNRKIEKSSAMCDWNPLLCHPLGSFMICYEWRDVTCKIWPLNLEFMAQVVSLTCLFLVVSFRCKLPLKKGQITVLRCGNNASLLRMLMTYSAKWINSSGRMRKKSHTSKFVNSVGITVVNFK